MREFQAQIVLIEDEKQIRRFLRMTLEAEGFRVHEAETGKQGLTDIRAYQPDLVILDLGLPDIDGVELIRQLRTWSSVPILILSARSEELQKVSALDAGADDYLTKPFGIPEMMARIRVHLRRRINEVIDTVAQVFTFGDVTVDFLHRRVSRKDQLVHLTPIEYKLLTALIHKQGRKGTHAHATVARGVGTGACRA